MDAREKSSSGKRLIDANALKERAIRMVTVNSLGNKQHCYFKAVGTDEIDKAPTVDAVEVIRCKDCKYGEVDNADFHDQYLCHISGSDWNCGNHFCSYGERKDGDGNG